MTHLIYEIKSRCEDLARGNNGKIRPYHLEIPHDYVQQLEAELHDTYKCENWEADVGGNTLSIFWDEEEWLKQVGNYENKHYHIDLYFDATVSYPFKFKVHCHSCGNKPLHSKTGHKFCPVCE